MQRFICFAHLSCDTKALQNWFNISLIAMAAGYVSFADYLLYF